MSLNKSPKGLKKNQSSTLLIITRLCDCNNPVSDRMTVFLTFIFPIRKYNLFEMNQFFHL